MATKCDHCKGKGRLMDSKGRETLCPACGGRGWIDKKLI